MYESIAASLFQSRTRSAVLDLLFHQGLTATVSELARRSGLTPRSVAMEVRNLLRVGLVTVEAVGGADLVRPDLRHPAAPHIQGLLHIPALPATQEARDQQVRESLAALGAPLAGQRPQEHLGLEDTLLAGLEAARSDGTLLRVLPVVLSKNLGRIDWRVVKEGARSRKLKAELGLLVDLTADLLDKPELRQRVADLHDRRRRVPRFYPAVRSDFERRLAKERSPAVARRWGFLMNMSVESFRSSLERHRGS
jgi:DNA-binding transcriptional ArsR family regulator